MSAFNFGAMASVFAPVMPVVQVHPKDFGTYMANKGGRNKYLRANRLGKFRKGKRRR